MTPMTYTAIGPDQNVHVEPLEGLRLNEPVVMHIKYEPATTGFYRLQIYSLDFNDTENNPDTQQRAIDESNFETGLLGIF